MSWQDEIEEMRAREALAFEMGGADKVARQHEFNKLTIRERIDAISGRRQLSRDRYAGRRRQVRRGRQRSGVHAIELRLRHRRRSTDRPVVLSGDDFTVRGGSADASIAGKRNRAEGLAAELRLPHVRLVDGMGGGGSVKTIETAGRTYIPELRGWEIVVQHLGDRALGLAGARLGGWHRRGPCRHLPTTPSSCATARR